MKRLRFPVIMVLTLLCICLFSGNTVRADETLRFTEGIFCYRVTDEKTKTVCVEETLITEGMHEIIVPASVSHNGIIYTVNEIYGFGDPYDENYYAFSGIKKLVIPETITGELNDIDYSFQGLEVIEFLGKKAPERISLELATDKEQSIVFVVPEGSEEEFRKVIHESLYYDYDSDMTEKAVLINSIIVNSESEEYEQRIIHDANGFIYNVTKCADKGVGEVELIGSLYGFGDMTFLKLPDTIKNGKYTYELTALTKYCLIGKKARVIVIPDTVKKMDFSTFDGYAEVIFLSKNCPVIPKWQIDDERNYSKSNIRFIYVPEGVTIIEEYAFGNNTNNSASIILPPSVEKIGKGGISCFSNITFSREKPLSNITKIIGQNSTVKVPEKYLTSYKKALKKISTVTVKKAKDVVQTSQIKISDKPISASTLKTLKCAGTLDAKSNETLNYVSTDTDIFEVDSNGTINPKHEGKAWLVVFTKTSGLYRTVEVNIKYEAFKSGLFSYVITDPIKKTVKIHEITPKKNTKTVTIPGYVTHHGTKYTVTAVSSLDFNENHLYDSDYSEVITGKYAKKNKIKKIVFPETITEDIGYFGSMNKIKTIVFNSKTAPDNITGWHLDGGLLSFNAIIYVPSGSEKAYEEAFHLTYSENLYSYTHYGCWMTFNITPTGSDEVQIFIKDGVLYKVVKRCSSVKNSTVKQGTVKALGTDVSLTDVKIPDTVTNGKYIYKVKQK